MILSSFDIPLFLAEYWQQKPCVIRGFMPNFEDPLDEHDLAGLAQEAEVDSRIVSQHDGQWQLSTGPFEDFDSVCTGDWSLLVQGVDRYIEEVSRLSAHIEFAPNWRLDDVMVSFSVAGAGVGAHLDQYDVFIVQGKGSRRWQVGLPDDYEEILPHPKLKQISGFTAHIDEVLQAGDAIYIPPLHPHMGVALEDCLNYSIGFRAPTNADLMLGLCDEADYSPSVVARFVDKHAGERQANNLSSPVVSDNELSAMKQSIVALVQEQESEQALLQYLSRQYLEIEALQPGECFSMTDMNQMIVARACIVKTPGLKPIYKDQQDAEFCFFLDGNKFTLHPDLKQAAVDLLNSQQYQIDLLAFEDDALGHAWLSLLQTLLNQGYWELL